jgi:sulfofructose kinase
MISAVGISTLDHLLVVDGFNIIEGTFTATSYTCEGGGMSATALCAAARLGSKTRLFSKIGDDVNGQIIIRGLHKYNVDTKGCEVIRNANSFVSFVLINRNTGDKQFYNEEIYKIFEQKVRIRKKLLEGSRVLLVDGYWTEGAIEATAWAAKNNVPVVADFKEYFNGIDILLPYIDYLIIPDFFARKIAMESNNENVLRFWKSKIKGIPVITNGNKPGYYLINDKVKKIPVFRIKCIDSTGAGDAFHGAFCHFLALNQPIEICLQMASAVGALNCRAVGGRNALPDINELNNFIKK